MELSNRSISKIKGWFLQTVPKIDYQIEVSSASCAAPITRNVSLEGGP
jgi:hypothetical protein